MRRADRTDVGGARTGGRAREWTRRGAIGALAGAGLGFALFGARGGRDDPRLKNRLVLDYWEKWTGHEGAAMQKVVDDFNSSQDRIYVRYLVTGTIHQKALIAIAGGDAPDIIGMYSYNVPSYAEADAVLPLDELVRAHGLSLERYARGMRQVMTHGGRWWAVVNTGGTLALYYNKAIFREAGLDPEAPPRTTDELDSAQRAITRRADDGSIAGTGFLHMEPGWWSWIWGYLFGGTLYDETMRRALASSAPNIAAYEWMQGYTRALGVDAVEKFRSGFGPFGTSKSAFLTGEVAMVVQGPWMANQVVEFAPGLDYGVAPIPVAPALLDPGAPVTLIDTDVLMIPRNARHPEASMEFIAYTQRPGVVEFLATRHCKGSPLAEASESFLASHPNRGVRLHTALADSPRAFVAPSTPVWPEYKDVFDTAVQSMWKHTSDAAAKLAEVQARAQGAIDRYEAKRRLREPGGGRS